MRAVLTGVTGFLGSHLAPALKAAGWEVHALVRPTSRNPVSPAVDEVHSIFLRDTPELRQLLGRLRPDALLHLASSTVPGGAAGGFEDHYEHTVLPALGVAQALPDSVRLALFFGSSIEYGNQAPPFEESLAPRCCSAYAWGKIAAYHGVMELLGERGLPGCWLRPFLTFGPGPMHSQLIPSLIRGCYAGERIPLTSGLQTRDFLYVLDLCAMVLRILDHPERAKGEVLNLASGVPRSIREVAERIQALVGRGELAFGALPYRAQEPLPFYGSRAKFEALFGPVPLTPFDEALRVTVESYR